MNLYRKLAVVIIAMAGASTTRADLIVVDPEVDPILLDSTTLNLFASGSLNSIAGSGSGGNLVLPESATIDNFVLTISDFTVSTNIPVLPQSMTLRWLQTSEELYFTNARAPLEIGQSIIFAENTAIFNILLGYVDGMVGSNGSSPGFQVGMAWDFGGIDGSASAELDLSVFGTAPVTVPEPGTLALFAIGLLGFGLTRKRSA